MTNSFQCFFEVVASLERVETQYAMMGQKLSEAVEAMGKIQDKVEEYADEIFTRLDGGAHIYFCGLKGMMPGIQDMLAEVCKSKDIDYDEWVKGLKKEGQWHVEVY